jgi:hypothetical protein
MAKGDYIIFNNVRFQTVTAPGRRYGVMFNPSSSRSRFRIRDSGRRYSVRLTQEGIVEYSSDGDATWNRITPLKDPCTNQTFPKFVTHERLRTGERLPDILFDQIAVGRGRIIGKERGTDRLFHLYIDELFRGGVVRCNVGESPNPGGFPVDSQDDVVDADDFKDIPIPPFNMKIDPEYFTTDPPTVIIPPEGTREYSDHPASLRLPVFNELLDMGISDVMLVLERARTWYLKDTRSQQAIISQDDLGFSDQDLVDVFTADAIRSVLESIKKAAGENGDWFSNIILDRLFDPDQTANDWAGKIQAQGSGVMVFAAYAAVGVLLYTIGESGAIRSERGGKILIEPRKLLDFIAQPGNLKPKAKAHLDDAVAKIMELISQLMLRSRRANLQRYGARPDVNRPDELPADWTIEDRMPTPNQPPSWIPVQVRTTYMRRLGAGKGTWSRVYKSSDSFHLVWLAVNADGSLMAFGSGEFDHLHRTMQKSANGPWDGEWMPFADGDTAIKLAHTRNIDGRLEIIRIASDHRVFHSTQFSQNSKSFNVWQELYTSTDKRTSIAVEANDDGRLEAFAVDENNLVWHTMQTLKGRWSRKWERAFGPDDFLTQVWMAKNGAGVLEVVGIAPNNTIWTTKQKAAGKEWEGWSQIYSDDDHLTMLNIGRNPDGTLEIIGVAPVDKTIWRTWQDSPGVWSRRWQQLFQPDDTLEELWVTTNKQGWLEVVGVASDKTVWHSWKESPNGAFTSGWHQIETIEGRETLAVAPSSDGSIEIFGVAPLQLPDIITDQVWRMRIQADKRYAIQYSKVLDIGIGSSHWNENWQTHFGGEIHSLLAPRPLFQGERYSLTQYRFLNGPVIDGDAFNDGTTNFYMMVKLGPPGMPDAGNSVQNYAILWFDEQTYFTQRYRLLHPTDDTLGDLFSLPKYLRDNPDWYDFHLKKYWCPFRAKLINDDSRMALRRNVIAVTGKNPDTQQWEIYTIVFNYGLCDHSWRWRLFPQAEQWLVDADIAQDQDPQLPDPVKSGSGPAYVVPNTIDMRDDTFLHVRGSLRRNGILRVGRWLQRYLPADCRHFPDRHALDGTKPTAGFNHKWDFVTEDAYKRADKFYQFGVYENLIDSRAQYYKVELLFAFGATPTFAQVEGRVWRSDKNVFDGEDRLRMNTINFNWNVKKENGAIVKRMSSANPVDDELLVHEFRNKPSISMYEPTARFRILERKPLGLIAVFYDKRDDELQAASNLPQPTTLRHDLVEAIGIPDAWRTADGEPIPPPLNDPAFFNIRVLFKSNHRVEQPPNVRKAQILVDNAPGLRRLHVSFWTPQTEQEVCVNIWKVSLAAITPSGVFPIFSVQRFGKFVRRAQPDAPVPSDFTGDLGDAWRYDFDFDFAKEVDTDVRRFCTTDGHIEFGTSLWFEDIVGHRAIADELIFGVTTTV